jgi:hypothetical protein
MEVAMNDERDALDIGLATGAGIIIGIVFLYFIFSIIIFRPTEKRTIEINWATYQNDNLIYTNDTLNFIQTGKWRTK